MTGVRRLTFVAAAIASGITVVAQSPTALRPQPTLYVIGGGSRIVPPETQQKLKDTSGFMKIVEEFLP